MSRPETRRVRGPLARSSPACAMVGCLFSRDGDDKKRSPSRALSFAQSRRCLSILFLVLVCLAQGSRGLMMMTRESCWPGLQLAAFCRQWGEERAHALFLFPSPLPGDCREGAGADGRRHRSAAAAAKKMGGTFTFASRCPPLRIGKPNQHQTHDPDRSPTRSLLIQPIPSARARAPAQRDGITLPFSHWPPASPNQQTGTSERQINLTAKSTRIPAFLAQRSPDAPH